MIKPSLSAILLVVTLLLTGASAQSFPDVRGHWVSQLVDLSGHGIELQLDPPNPKRPYVLTGLVSLNLNGYDGPRSASVSGFIEADGTAQLLPVGPTGFKAEYVLDMQFDIEVDTLSLDVCKFGQKNLISLELRRFAPDPVPGGVAYRLEFGSRFGPTGTSADLSLPDRASGRFKMTPPGFACDTSEGPCRLFAPRHDPGFLIFTLVDDHDSFFGTIPFGRLRVPVFESGQTRKSYQNLGFDLRTGNRGEPKSHWSDRGTAILVTP